MAVIAGARTYGSPTRQALPANRWIASMYSVVGGWSVIALSWNACANVVRYFRPPVLWQ